MRIQARLSIIFISLLIFGVTAVSSYSIVFIRGYLLQSGIERLARDTKTYVIALSEIQEQKYPDAISYLQSNAEYGLALLDSLQFEDLSTKIKDKVSSKTYRYGEYQSTILHDLEQEILYSTLQIDEASFLVVTQSEEKLFEPVKTIRWIIYTGMFISIAIILVVSGFTARSLSRPILQLTDYASEIAKGKQVTHLFMNRNDEFGVLSKALNKMALTLKQDTEEIKLLYEKNQQFYADITHEIKNPLHAVGGTLELLELEGLSKEQKSQHIKNAKLQIERMNRLFNDMLTLQKFDSHELTIQKERFDFAELTKQVCHNFKSAAQKEQIELVIPHKEEFVIADRDRIMQVLENLVSNAIHYSKATQVQVKTKIISKELVITISDDGIGIAEEHLPKLFDRFYRADSSRARKHGGTGLGLSIVKSIIENHQKTIKVDSSVGTGTKFTFSLDLA